MTVWMSTLSLFWTLVVSGNMISIYSYIAMWFLNSLTWCLNSLAIFRNYQYYRLPLYLPNYVFISLCLNLSYVHHNTEFLVIMTSHSVIPVIWIVEIPTRMSSDWPRTPWVIICTAIFMICSTICLETQGSFFLVFFLILSRSCIASKLVIILYCLIFLLYLV